MKKIDTFVDKFTPEQNTLIDMHGILNIANILNSLVNHIHLQYDKKNILLPSLEQCKYILDSLSNKKGAQEILTNCDNYKSSILKNIYEAINFYPEIKNEAIIQKYLSAFDSLFFMLSVRVRDALLLVDNPNKITHFEKEVIKASITDFLEAIEKNSFNNYKIVYNIAKKRENDYLINLSIDSEANETLKMPIVFNDVIRDTIANARKYSPGGGIINAGLYEDKEFLTYVVSDNGMGIPDRELQKVTQFGQRGSNGNRKKTFGGGIGLTKALAITKRFDGDMWIGSKEGEGTEIKIILPKSSYLFN